MSTHAVGTVAHVQNVPANDFGITSGLSLHLDADRVWRATDGSGVQFCDEQFDTYAPYATVVFDAPAQETQRATEDKRALAVGTGVLALIAAYNEFVVANDNLANAWDEVVASVVS